MLGYAQLLDDDPSIPEARRQAVRVIKRGGDHLLSLIEGKLDAARIEGGSSTLEPAPAAARACSRSRARLSQQTQSGIGFVAEIERAGPERARRRQAAAPDPHQPAGQRGEVHAQRRVVFRPAGRARSRISEIEDTGLARRLTRWRVACPEPFAWSAAGRGGRARGAGLGLMIAKMLNGLMGGDGTVTKPTRPRLRSSRAPVPA
ncbi:MAG: hypothetical protein IPP50_18845 [Piscinibacter sp.]|nr:hypothetical protein [Piscinibacter sp.]